MIRFITAAVLAIGLSGCGKVHSTPDGGVDSQSGPDAEVAQPPATGRGGRITSGAQRMTGATYRLEARVGQFHIQP